MRRKLVLSRDTDPFLADDTPVRRMAIFDCITGVKYWRHCCHALFDLMQGPGAYQPERHRSMATGPAYSMRSKLKVSANTDPWLADEGGPGPGTYDTDKY